MADYNIEAKINYGNLKNVIKAMSKEYSVKVGLLANKGGADEISKDMDVAGLGALQEFGCDIKITQKMAAYLHLTAEELGLPKLEKQGDGYVHIPARSWLQMPLERRQALKKRIISKYGDYKEVVEDDIAQTGDLYSLALMVGSSAVELIQEAFDTDGFGQWQPNSPYTAANKGSEKPLVDKGKLRGAVTFEVGENG